MEKITWIYKTKGGVFSKSDVSVTERSKKDKGQRTFAVIFRNGTFDCFDDYISVGFSEDGKKMFFAPCNEDGWKLSGNKNSSTRGIQVASDKAKVLERFIGDYDIEITDEGFRYIDYRKSL